MSLNPPTRLSFSPGIRIMIPLLYAAWSDRVLTPSEVKTLQDKARSLQFLQEADKVQLLQWSTPSRPPTRDLFKFWEISCQQAAQKLAASEQQLTSLGLALVSESGQRPEWLSAEDLAQLEELEKALGALNVATFRSLFSPLPETIRKQENQKASFDIQELAVLLDGTFADTKVKTRTILQDPAFQLRHFITKEEHRAQALKWCQLLAQQGMGALSYPKAHGGQGEMGQYAAVFETLGYLDASLSIKFGVQFGLWGGSILALGTEKHHARYLRDTGTLDLLGCYAMTETGHGSNVRGLETTATYDSATDELIIHSPRKEAGKEFIGNALDSTVASVFAQLIVNEENHGVHAIVVPLRNEKGELLEGRTVEDNGYKLGLNGVDNGRIWFNQVRVPRANLLDHFGGITDEGAYHSKIENPSRRFFTMLGTLVGGRVCVPRAGLSATKKALTIAIRYATKRRQFAPSATRPETPILDYPSHQRRLLPLLAKTYAIQFGLDYLMDRYLQRTEDDMREIETLAAGMKSYATWFTTAAIQECREACGGKGYLAENQFAALKADTDIYTTFEGDNTVLMQLVAKGLLTEYKQSFHEDGNMAILRYLGRRVNTAFTEQNPFAIRNTDQKHLRSSSFQCGAFKFREDRLLYSLAQRLRGHIKNGKSAYEAAMICQTHMLTLAEAFAERVTMDAIAKAAKSSKGQSTHDILRKLRSLYALHTIEKHAAWYLEQDYLAPVKSKAIRRQVDHLCSELRPEAIALTEAFSIPDSILAAPIAF